MPLQPTIYTNDLTAANQIHYNHFAQVQKQLEKEKAGLPVSNNVLELEINHNTLLQLCSEILATLQLEGNAHLFDNFPHDWPVFVGSWQERYEQLKDSK